MSSLWVWKTSNQNTCGSSTPNERQRYTVGKCLSVSIQSESIQVDWNSLRRKRTLSFGEAAWQRHFLDSWGYFRLCLNLEPLSKRTLILKQTSVYNSFITRGQLVYDTAFGSARVLWHLPLNVFFACVLRIQVGNKLATTYSTNLMRTMALAARERFRIVILNFWYFKDKVTAARDRYCECSDELRGFGRSLVLHGCSLYPRTS